MKRPLILALLLAMTTTFATAQNDNADLDALLAEGVAAAPSYRGAQVALGPWFRNDRSKLWQW